MAVDETNSLKASAFRLKNGPDCGVRWTHARWAAGHALAVHGVIIGLRATDTGTLTRLRPILPPEWRTSRATRVDRLYSIVGTGRRRGPARGPQVVYRDCDEFIRPRDFEELSRLLAGELSQAVATLAPRRVFVHAGVVGWKGRALLLPGRTLAGKSTLVTALVRAGATYYSDEWAVLDDRGRVHPYPRPISLRRSPEDGGGEEAIPVGELGGRAGKKSLPVTLVVMTHFDRQSRWRPRPLSPALGALAMLEHTVQTSRDPARVLGVLRAVVSRAVVLTGPRGQATETAAALLSRLSDLR